MSWAAANGSQFAQDRRHDSASSTAATATSTFPKRSTETVEAALSRLSKAYTSSMECIGALQQTNRMLLKEDDPSIFSDERLDVLEKVAIAARSTLETALLLDPLIVPHIPTLHETMQSLCSSLDHNEDSSSCDEQAQSQLRWARQLENTRPEPPVLTSVAHKTTVRELAYLALVNYSDLLQICRLDRSGGSSRSMSEMSLLDRGVVTKIQTLHSKERCCWKGESQKDTQRLAVTALCDASNLDGSDPVMWLKMACASRQLEKIMQSSTMGLLKHRRFQRYALEQGSRALPDSMPPNRAVERALRELLGEPEPQFYESASHISNDSVILVLDLPRYSWSVLGRLLLRVCREGTDFHQGQHKHHHSHAVAPSLRSDRLASGFGSPRIQINLSPTLVLPVPVLGRICLFLDRGSIRRFESTCRALSVSIMSARAILEDEKQRELESTKGPLPDSRLQAMTEGIEGDNVLVGSRAVIKKKSQESVKEQEHIRSSREHSRSSQRLRSQQITTGKKMERFGKRQSFEYCFLSATLGCSADEHKAALEDAKIEESIRRLLPRKEKLLKGQIQQSVASVTGKRRELQLPTVESSLSSFVEQWSGANSGPMDLVQKYLVHVATNVEDVFASDASGTVALTSCILSCFDALLRRSGYLDHLVPCFYKGLQQTGNLSKSLEGFALDVLHCELILKQRDRCSPVNVAYDDGNNMICVMVPQLYQACDELEKTFLQAGQTLNEASHRYFARLKIRCSWLFAGFYLWRSGIAQNVWESQDAEEEGTAFIEETLRGFESPHLDIRVLQTPHLVSPARTEPYWRELSPSSLRKYRDEIQAATVVSVVRENFQDLVVKISSRKVEAESDAQLTDADSKALVETGEKLYERYRPNFREPELKLGELVEDFLSAHGNALTAIDEDTKKHTACRMLESFIPLGQVDIFSLQKMTNPSILTMLVVCMMVETTNRERVQQLLVGLVLETRKMHQDILRRITLSRLQDGVADDDFSDSEDHSVMSDDSDSRGISNKNIDERRAIQCGYLVAYLIERIDKCLAKASDTEQQDFAISHHCTALLEAALEMSSEWFESTSLQLAQDDMADLRIFQSVGALVGRLHNCLSTENDQQSFDMKFIGGLSRITIAHQHHFSSLVMNHGDRSSRVAKQRLCIRRAEYIGAVTSEIGVILSRHPCIVENLVLVHSTGLWEPESTVEGIVRRLSKIELKFLIHSAHWLWSFSSQTVTESQGSENPVCSSFDRPLVKLLRVPVASLVIGLCGSTAMSRDVRDTIEGNDESLCLSEFYDTDDSANGGQWEDDEKTVEHQKRRELLRVACHAVQCINLVLDKIDDKGALSIVPVYRCAGLGPLLPLVASRVLNFFADALLLTIAEDGKDTPDLWASQYPTSTRTIGEILDSNLHKVYRWMYGFVLVGEKSHLQTSGKDLASSTAPIVDLAVSGCRLENLSEAASLYRCIVRAYRGGRRSPPKRALEFVSAALPTVNESAKTTAIRNFVFSASDSYLSQQQVEKIVSRASGWDEVVASIRDQLTESMDDDDTTRGLCNDTEVAMRIRRGILSHLADGVLPVLSNENTKGKSDQAQDDDRVTTMKNEEELGKKFDAILDAICLGDARNSGSWYRAAQCLNAKAELIADRLGRNKAFASTENYTIPLPQHRTVRGIHLDALLQEQKDADELIDENWIHYLGNNLAAYVTYTWASHESLRVCSERVGEHCRDLMVGSGETEKRRQYIIWKSIDALDRKGDYLSWQEAWGGMFVFALRKMAVRLMAVAHYLLESKEERTAEEKVLMSELCESMGLIFYSDLSGSQNYGYPMRSMGARRKRALAMTAKVCFEGAVAWVNEPEKADDESEEGHTTWDLMFIIGKCEEKIAGTYILQSFPNQKDEPGMTRMYERHMVFALNHFLGALAQVKKIEKDGGSIVDQSGGSSHGRTEIEYRILAVRLKSLIASAVREEREFDQAEEEALRLAGCHWFREPEDLNLWKRKDSRDRVWVVLADIVAGLAQCRADQPFFHRSVYRHAQALMWAPVLYDPTCAEGSLGCVPASHSILITGLNGSTPASQSAECVIRSLFEKKRSQLCAVWVTPSSSPFQVLNTSPRKYDSLRGKYISSYIECLRLSNRRAKLETFLKWLASTPRDVASYFQASGKANGGLPPKSHMNDALLVINESLSAHSFMTSIKRVANSAFAGALMHEMSQRHCKKVAVDEKKQAENDLKFAFATFLRLNCSKADLDAIRAWSYHKNPIREVDTLCQAYLGLESEGEIDSRGTGGKADFGDWTGGGRKEAVFVKALAKCQALFPNLTPNFFSKKASSSSKARNDGSEGDVDDPTPGNINNKRKEIPASTTQPAAASAGEEMVTISYEVVVPAGLTPGQSFLTTINVGGTKKKFRLTVPAANPSTLRFKTQIPRSSVPNAPSPKKPRVDVPTAGTVLVTETLPPATMPFQGQDAPK